jgi:hypothetical protein
VHVVNGDRRIQVLGCDQLRELAPELGLGILTGIERANALAHLETCPPCQALVENMVELTDTLCALGPEIEPPAGFEGRLLARRQSIADDSSPAHTPGAARRWRWPALVAAAATMAAVGMGLGLGLGGQPGFQVERPGAVSALGGKEFSAALLNYHGQERGQVFVYAGQPSWVFMTVETPKAPERITCKLELEGGSTVVLGSFAPSTGYSSWGSTLSVDPKVIKGVRLVNANGQTVATATL